MYDCSYGKRIRQPSKNMMTPLLCYRLQKTRQQLVTSWSTWFKLNTTVQPRCSVPWDRPGEDALSPGGSYRESPSPWPTTAVTSAHITPSMCWTGSVRTRPMCPGISSSLSGYDALILSLDMLFSDFQKFMKCLQTNYSNVLGRILLHQWKMLW